MLFPRGQRGEMLHFHWQRVLGMTDGAWYLWVVSQVDLSGDVVDSANPL